jgi:hypothetical protein
VGGRLKNWKKKLVFVNLTLDFDVISAQDALRYKNTNISLSGPSIKKKLNFLVPKSYPYRLRYCKKKLALNIL